MSGKIKISKADGITVKVNMFKERYLVEILVPEEARKEEMHVKNRDFIFSLKMKSKWYGPIKIILKEKYKTYEHGLVNIHDHTKLEFDGQKYCGTISLSPNFYLSPKTRKKAKEEKEKNQELAKAFKKSIVNIDQQPKPSASIYTNYKYNNASKPYIGGKVSPK